MTDDYRYQLREVRDGERYCIASAPDCQGIGLALRVLREEGEISHGSQLGVYDAEERAWLINPYARAPA